MGLNLGEFFWLASMASLICQDILSKAGHLDVDAVHFAVQQGRLWLRGPAPTTLGTIPAATTTETTASIFSEESRLGCKSALLGGYEGIIAINTENPVHFSGEVILPKALTWRIQAFIQRRWQRSFATHLTCHSQRIH